MRKVEFANDEVYHIYNRGVDKRNILSSRQDLNRFLVGLFEFNSIEPIGSLRACGQLKNKTLTPKSESERLVDVVCYCLNRNHYHLILKQLVDNGISKFMHRWGTSCTKYFNTKYHRTGVLFQGKFKAVHISDNERLLELSVYVNLNSELHAKASKNRSRASVNLTKSSWDFYSGQGVEDWILSPNLILGQFETKKVYEKLAKDYFPSLLKRKEEEKELEKLMIE